MQKKFTTVLPLISSITFLGFLDTHLLVPILALYASGLGASVWLTGLVVGLYSLTNTPANIFFGRLIDRVGYKLPLLVGLIGDALSMFLYSLCRIPLHLALVRMIHGLSGGMVGPATMAVTAEQSGSSNKARTMSIYGISLASATLVGYPVSGVVVSRLGYGALFYLGAGLVVMGLLLSLFLPGTVRNDDTTAKSGQYWDTRKAKDLFKRQGLLIAYCGIFAQYFTFGGVVTLLPLYVKELGMGAFHVGMLLAVFAVVFIIVQVPSGMLSDRLGRTFPVIAGFGMAIVALVLLATMQTFSLLAVAMALYGIAYGLLFPAVSASVADCSGQDERGLATGIFHALLTTGVAVGAPLIGWIGGMIGVHYGLLCTAGAMALSLIVVLTISRR